MFGRQSLVDLLTLIQARRINAVQAKSIMMLIVDGDKRTPTQIAAESGMLEEKLTEAELTDQCRAVIAEN